MKKANTDMQNINLFFNTVRLLILCCLLAGSPLISHASELIYTVQTGSFLSVGNAQKQVDSIVQKLNEQELDHLRIEKKGKFYPVRIGRFDNYTAAKTYLEAINAKLPGSIVMTAYMNDEKIVKQYTRPLLPRQQEVEAVLLPVSVDALKRVQAVEWSEEPAEKVILTEAGVYADNAHPVLASASGETKSLAAVQSDMPAENEASADAPLHAAEDGSSSAPVSEVIRLAAETSAAKTDMGISAESSADGSERGNPDEGTPGMNRRNSLGLKMSTLGAGLEAQRSLSESIGARVSVNYMIINYNVVIDNIEYDIDLHLQSAAAMVDWHPFKGTFRISGGVMYNDNYLDADARSATTYDIGDAKYTNLEVGSLTGKIDFNDITPYIGFGWDTSFGNNNRYGFIVDLGVVYQGTPKVEFSTNGTKENDPLFQENLQKEEDELQKQLDGYEYYPVIGFGLSYRF